MTKYMDLSISAKSPLTDIYIADSRGFLVQKAVGKLSTSLSPDYYTIHFGIQGRKLSVNLRTNMNVKE